MKKMKNYGVQELPSNEIKETSGGESPISFWDVYFWMWSKADAVGPQNPGANGYMGSKI